MTETEDISFEDIKKFIDEYRQEPIKPIKKPPKPRKPKENRVLNITDDEVNDLISDKKKEVINPPKNDKLQMFIDILQRKKSTYQ